ncbi:hypothetical protein PSTT_02741 [Puccinia striiformis]|uniref:RWD domain-containing protein n=1 Tax=Puccinia striiformis TaxID=27350 RepID=A0A2S4VYY6_9BASI|nr:hypothetical protein PSTT_02741 [Puccinia striiformis]
MSEQHLEQRKEEIEVLQSIFEDLTFESDDQVILRTGPEEPSASNPLTVNLKIKYTENYPDELPEIRIESVEGELTELELESTIEKLKEAGRESIGMAMIFTLSLALQQELGQILSDRAIEVIRLEQEETKKTEEAEAARKKGTPINKETFAREERKKSGTKLTGRRLFETNQALITSDNSLIDADAEELDLSQFPNKMILILIRLQTFL